MPSRLTCIAIVAFWLAVCGWWARRELLPRLDPGEPRPFTIDLADEVRTTGMRISWTIFRDGQRIGSALTMVRYREEDDAFELDGRFGFTTELAEVRLHSRYGVDHAEKLRSVQADLTCNLLLTKPPTPFEAHIGGPVKEGRLRPTAWVLVGGRRIDLRLPPVEVPAGQGVLNPLHPVNRIVGLRPGQRWRQPSLDALAAALSGLVPGMPPPEATWLMAEVLPRPQRLDWGGQPVPCLVIRYQGDDGTEASCWVRQEDGLVLRQEVSSGSVGRLVLQRNP